VQQAGRDRKGRVMGDYSPVYMPGAKIGLTASATIAGGQLVQVSGAGTVAPTSGATPSVKVVGVAAHDAVTGQRVTVHGRGQVHETVADGAVTAGDQVVSGSVAGTVQAAPAVTTPTPDDVTNTRAVVGIALTTA